MQHIRIPTEATLGDLKTMLFSLFPI